MLEHLIDIIDKIEDHIGDHIYLSMSAFKEYFLKYFSNQVLLEKTYNSLLDKDNFKDEVLKFELFSVLILLSKGSFEAKINSKHIT